MRISTINDKHFELLDESGMSAGKLLYTNNAFENAVIETGRGYLLNAVATGTWITMVNGEVASKHRTRIRVETGGVISIWFPGKRKKYFFKKSAGWKLRFSLLNREQEELLTLVPNVNWQKGSHDYNLQLNEEFETECDSFLILQAVHCANVSLSMMTGGEVPALVSL